MIQRSPPHWFVLIWLGCKAQYTCTIYQTSWCESFWLSSDPHSGSYDTVALFFWFLHSLTDVNYYYLSLYGNPSYSDWDSINLILIRWNILPADSSSELEAILRGASNVASWSSSYHSLYTWLHFTSLWIWTPAPTILQMKRLATRVLYLSSWLANYKK